jgi:hypothetical protein
MDIKDPGEGIATENLVFKSRNGFELQLAVTGDLDAYFGSKVTTSKPIRTGSFSHGGVEIGRLFQNTAAISN